MIPKVIHYCWFGGNTLSQLSLKCIESWKKYCFDYEIKEWNENNFDINYNLFVREAYEAQKWAFVSDVARLYILYKHGGIYMDVDVEVIKPINNLLNHKSFTGFESEKMIPTGIMATEYENKWIEKLLKYYNDKHFNIDKKTNSYNMIPNTQIITEITLENYKFIPNNTYQELSDVTLYPTDYFCPKEWWTGNINITDNTYTIHHFNASWWSDEQKRILEKDKKFQKVKERYLLTNKLLDNDKK